MKTKEQLAYEYSVHEKSQYDFIQGYSAAQLESEKREAVLLEALNQIKKVKYGLELSDYDNMEYVADYWAKQALNYETIARESIAKYNELKTKGE